MKTDSCHARAFDCNPFVQLRQLGVVGCLEKLTSVLANISTDGWDDAQPYTEAMSGNDVESKRITVVHGLEHSLVRQKPGWRKRLRRLNHPPSAVDWIQLIGIHSGECPVLTAIVLVGFAQERRVLAAVYVSNAREVPR